MKHIPSSLSIDLTHIISAVALAKALYSASVLDRDTVACFFAHQEIKFGPKKTAKPPVDLLSSKQPAQSESEKAVTSVEDDLLKARPTLKALHISVCVWRQSNEL